MPWYVLHATTGTEARLAEDITEAAKKLQPGQLRAYCPMEKRLKDGPAGRARKRAVVEGAVLPGYLFVFVGDDDDGFHLIREQRGAIRFLGEPDENGRPPEFPGRDVMAFRVAEAAGEFDFTPKRREFGRGAKLRICKGPFTGWKATFLSERPEERVRVLLQSIVRGGGEHEMELDREAVELVE